MSAVCGVSSCKTRPLAHSFSSRFHSAGSPNCVVSRSRMRMLSLLLSMSLLLVSAVATTEYLHVAGPAPVKELNDRRGLLVIGDRGVPLTDYQVMLDAVAGSSSFGIQQYVSANSNTTCTRVS
eukprot:12450-Heterococcus_DN1.PRE.1